LTFTHRRGVRTWQCAQYTHCLVYLRFVLSLFSRLRIRRKICLLVFVGTTWIMCIQSDSPSILSTHIHFFSSNSEFIQTMIFGICKYTFCHYGSIFFIPFKKHILHVAIINSFFRWERKEMFCRLLNGWFH